MRRRRQQLQLIFVTFMTMPSRVERLPFAVSGMTQCVLRLTGGASGITDCGDALAFGRT